MLNRGFLLTIFVKLLLLPTLEDHFKHHLTVHFNNLIGSARDPSSYDFNRYFKHYTTLKQIWSHCKARELRNNLTTFFKRTSLLQTKSFVWWAHNLFRTGIKRFNCLRILFIFCSQAVPKMWKGYVLYRRDQLIVLIRSVHDVTHGYKFSGARMRSLLITTSLLFWTGLLSWVSISISI